MLFDLKKDRIVLGNRYHLVDLVGEGGLSIVYSAIDGETGRRVAIKILRKSLDLEGIEYQSAWDEAIMTANLLHPNIVSVYDYGECEHGGYIVMELLHGRTLDFVMEEGPVNLTDFCALAQQSLLALDHAHAMRLIHCDIKPTNIMILKRLPDTLLKLKLLDFGISRYEAHLNSTAVEQGDTILGSVFYCAPEMLYRQKMDGRTDIYSLGHVLFHAVSGKTAVTAVEVNDVVDAHANGKFRRLHELNTALPEAVCDWVHQLIQTNPEDRPNDAAEALVQFKSALLSDGVF